MPIQIKAPDGSIAQFPDGTPDHVIESTMAKEYAQPSFLQTLAASPVGRFAHDSLLPMLETPARLLAKIDPTGGAVAPAADKLQAGYQDALATQHNRPGYAEARQAADSKAAARGAGGLTDQIIAPLAPAAAGAAGGLFGGSLNASNAAADAQTAAQDKYAAQNPITSTVARVGGGFLAGPGGTASRVPVATGDSALINRSAGLDPANVLPAKQPVPSIANLKAAAKAAYDKVDQSGQIISAPSYDAMVDSLRTKLANEGIDKTLHPNALAAFQRLNDAKGQNVTFKGVDTLRKVAGDAIGASGMNKADQRLGYTVQNHIDDFVDGLTPTDLVAGQGAADPAATVSALNDARGLYSRAAQAQTIQTQLDKAALKSQMYSQSGLENATRSQFRSLALNDKAMKRLSPDVQQAVKDVATGSPVGNVLRAVGKYAPHGPVAAVAGVGTGMMLGGSEGGMMGAIALPAVGELARAGATRFTSKAAQRALDIAALGKTRIAPLSVPPLQLPSLSSNALPYGLFGSMSQAQQNQ